MLEAMAQRGGVMAYKAFGKSAIYQDLLGGTRLLTVIEDTEADITPDGTLSATAEDLRVVTVRTAELATPERGGQLTVGEAVYQVQHYEQADVQGLEWLLTVRRVLTGEGT